LKARLSFYSFCRAAFTFAICASATAQQPFNTDDAEVTPKGKWHFECSNEFDQLRKNNFPNLRQDTANFKFAYGLRENMEVGLDNQVLVLYNGPAPSVPLNALGLGDLDFSVKYKFHKEKEGSWLPDLAASLGVEFPTGDSSKQLGSGLTDYVINGIAQKTLTERTKLRLNAGFVAAGNTLTGVVGVRTRGTIYTSGVSVVRAFTPKLQLGAELTGALTSNFLLANGGQLQTQVGGNYELRKDFTLDFGVTTGFYATSPRVGAQLGFSINF
jgi:Putative MetA-pathway of phenol degradation